jgi:hypothetical protein
MPSGTTARLFVACTGLASACGVPPVPQGTSDGGSSSSSGAARIDGGSSSSGGSGSLDGSARDATADAPADTGSEAGPVCVTDLSNVGAGDFHVAFTLTTTAGSIDMALLNQRTGCDESSTWWDVSYIPSTSTTGAIEVATDDGTHYVVVEQAAGAPPDDGAPHRIVVARSGGQLGFTIDGATAGGPLADPYAFGAMPALKIGMDACPGFGPTVGMITNVCIATP